MTRFTILCLSLLLFGGCGSTADTNSPSTGEGSASRSIVTPDDDSVVAAVESVTEKLRRDGNGSIIEVDFRDTPVTDADLEPLARLPRLRSVLLLGTGVTDAGLQSIGKISTLENLDLRKCKVSDSGLAELSSLAKLKALKLSNTDVTDDGLQHLASLANLKSLALDFAWVSEVGLEKNVEDLLVAGGENEKKNQSQKSRCERVERGYIFPCKKRYEIFCNHDLRHG